MNIQIHLPRLSEATIQPEEVGEEDITVTPKFYKKTGNVNVLHFSVAGKHRHETERYALIISAASGQLRLEKLVEVVPECDEPPKPKDK